MGNTSLNFKTFLFLRSVLTIRQRQIKHMLRLRSKTNFFHKNCSEYYAFMLKL